MISITLTKEILGVFIAKCQSNQVTPSSIITITNDGQHTKIFAQQSGDEQVLIARSTNSVQSKGAESG